MCNKPSVKRKKEQKKIIFKKLIKYIHIYKDMYIEK